MNKTLLVDEIRILVRVPADLPKAESSKMARILAKKPFRTRSFDGGGVLVKSIDSTAELLAEIEGEAWR